MGSSRIAAAVLVLGVTTQVGEAHNSWHFTQLNGALEPGCSIQTAYSELGLYVGPYTVLRREIRPTPRDADGRYLYEGVWEEELEKYRPVMYWRGRLHRVVNKRRIADVLPPWGYYTDAPIPVGSGEEDPAEYSLRYAVSGGSRGDFWAAQAEYRTTGFTAYFTLVPDWPADFFDTYREKAFNLQYGSSALDLEADYATSVRRHFSGGRYVLSKLKECIGIHERRGRWDQAWDAHRYTQIPIFRIVNGNGGNRAPTPEFAPSLE